MKSGKREKIAVIIILCLSITLSIPLLIEDIRVYRSRSYGKSDIWSVSAPQKQGMDRGLLSEADKYMRSTDACSLIVVRHGNIVLEKYYNGFKRDDRSNIYSVTKSFISALVGIAIEQGYIKDAEQKVYEFFPEYFNANTDPVKREMTIEHLLTMTPGFCENLDSWTGSSNWIQSAIELPQNFKPGKKFQYANSATHMLSGILTKATGMSTLQFAEENLFKPLGMVRKRWDKDPQEIYAGFSNLYLRPRDMARFGLLYLSNGIWEGRQLIPSAWVEESVRNHVSFTEEENRFQRGYGYKWWLSSVGKYFVYSAKGYGGQNVCVIPELDMVVVTASVPDGSQPFGDENLEELLKSYIIPAVG